MKRESVSWVWPPLRLVDLLFTPHTINCPTCYSGHVYKIRKAAKNVQWLWTLGKRRPNSQRVQGPTWATFTRHSFEMEQRAMLVWCWAIVADAGPTSNQHCSNQHWYRHDKRHTTVDTCVHACIINVCFLSLGWGYSQRLILNIFILGLGENS